jgi:probable rRNA maturation factor
MIHVKSKPGLRVKIPSRLLRQAAQRALEHEAVPKPHTLTILLSDDSRLQKLNRDYLGIDAPTDVLSFPSGETDLETGETYLGDVIISASRAARQAADAGHPLDTEAQLLVVHGVLHLVGHDHLNAREKARMWKAQWEILDSLGLGHIQIREE